MAVIGEKIQLIPSQNFNTQSMGQKPNATLWLNVGYVVEIPDPDTGELIEKFISLPFGIPIDTMDPLKIPAPNGKNEDYRQLVAAKNDLLEQLKEIGKKMAGGTVVEPQLQLQLRKVDTSEHPIPTSSNPYTFKVKF